MNAFSQSRQTRMHFTAINIHDLTFSSLSAVDTLGDWVMLFSDGKICDLLKHNAYSLD